MFQVGTPMSSPLKRLSAAGNAVSSMWQGRSFFFSLHSPEAAPAIEVGAGMRWDDVMGCHEAMNFRTFFSLGWAGPQLPLFSYKG